MIKKPMFEGIAMNEKKIYSELIDQGRSVLGLELGSTRIKAILMDQESNSIATGSYEWENQLIDGIWTYDLASVVDGIQCCFKDLVLNVRDTYGVIIRRVSAIGVNGMMHGYLAFDKDENLLVPFRTWRNSMTSEASEYLTSVFEFNIPQRWSVAHLYQAILNGEEDVEKVDYITTLSGYVHWLLTGNKALGICDASGMFPIDSDTMSYSKRMMDAFNEAASGFVEGFNVEKILPEVYEAGLEVGKLSDKGAFLLDPTGYFESGIPMCPPEGDAGTGMVATNSIKKRNGNISAGTSLFAMVVLEKSLSKP